MKVTFGKEVVINKGTRFKHKGTGDIYTFEGQSNKSFQRVHKDIYKRVSDGEFAEYARDEVELLDQ